MRNLMVTVSVMFVAMLPADAVAAQRGTGERDGVARQDVKPEVQTITGILKEIKTDPCQQTTGRSPVGTHLLLQGEKALLNVHLGPASEVGDVVGMVRVGDTVEVKAFRTPRLPENQFIAASVKFGDQEIVLRDGFLRPRWAGGGRSRGGQPGQGRVEQESPLAARGLRIPACSPQRASSISVMNK